MNASVTLRLRLAGTLGELEEGWDQLEVVARLAGLDVSEAAQRGSSEIAVLEAEAAWPPAGREKAPAFFAAVRALDLDVALLPSRPLVGRGVFCFDADSTLVMGEGIDQLAALAGVETQVAAVTDRAMAGELDYGTSLRERVALLAGLPVSELAAVARDLELRPGAPECVRALRARGWPVVVLSGGFSFYLEEIQRRLDVDDYVGNRLEIRDGRLTGRVEGEILDAGGKARALDLYRSRYDADFTVAIGDGANDRPLLEAATVGLGVVPRDALLPVVDGVLSGRSFDRLLPLLGL